LFCTHEGVWRTLRHVGDADGELLARKFDLQATLVS
jgi:hypothetical protein